MPVLLENMGTLLAYQNASHALLEPTPKQA
jgi:hypothetical protein